MSQTWNFSLDSLARVTRLWRAAGIKVSGFLSRRNGLFRVRELLFPTPGSRSVRGRSELGRHAAQRLGPAGPFGAGGRARSARNNRWARMVTGPATTGSGGEPEAVRRRRGERALVRVAPPRYHAGTNISYLSPPVYPRSERQRLIRRHRPIRSARPARTGPVSSVGSATFGGSCLGHIFLHPATRAGSTLKSDGYEARVRAQSTHGLPADCVAGGPKGFVANSVRRARRWGRNYHVTDRVEPPSGAAAENVQTTRPPYLE